MFRGYLRLGLASGLIGLLTAINGANGTSASASPAPLTIAYVTSLTGPGAPDDTTSPAAFEARLDLANAAGGVHGHKLVPLIIDDQSSPTAIATGVQEALSKGVIGIVSESALFFLAAKYPQQAGVPVTGFYGDGPEWGEQPYTNMFASDHGSVDPKYPANTLLGTFLRQHGGTVLGSYGYGISPQSSAAARGNAESFQKAGGKVGVLDTTVPFGDVNFTSTALVAKEAHVNAVVPSLDDSSNYALAESLEQAGATPKVTLYATGYQPSVINSAAWPSLQGAYFLSLFRPFSLPNAGTRQMQAAMEKYAHFSKSDFPSFAQYEGWSGANLMIEGLEAAGPSPTRASVIKALRDIKSYNDNGMLPNTIDYSTVFGHDLPDCTWIMQAKGPGFVATSPNPICGHDIPGTSTLSSNSSG